MKTDAEKRFKEIFNRNPDTISSAPGRINIIGEHTDYNQGLVLPAAIDLHIQCVAARRDDETVSAWSETFGEREEFFLGDLSVSSTKNWANYLKGIFWILEQEGYTLRGMDALITGNIPLASGLSSSAALEICVLNAVGTLHHLSLPKEKLARLAQRAENDFVGVECGLMDQFISVFGRKDKALFLDCETLDCEYVPLDLEKHGLEIVVCDSRVRRELAASKYNIRRSESAAALRILRENGVSSYKDASVRLLDENASKLGDVLLKRARHVVTENLRVESAVRALKIGDFQHLGELLFLSHLSLRDDYEVSCPELDLLYTTGKSFEGCLGARLTGAGFGGSGIALIEKDKCQAFRERMLEESKERGFILPAFYTVAIGEGALVR